MYGPQGMGRVQGRWRRHNSHQDLKISRSEPAPSLKSTQIREPNTIPSEITSMQSERYEATFRSQSGDAATELELHQLLPNGKSIPYIRVVSPITVPDDHGIPAHRTSPPRLVLTEPDDSGSEPANVNPPLYFIFGTLDESGSATVCTVSSQHGPVDGWDVIDTA